MAMTTMATAATGWTDYAILQPSVPRLNKKGEPVEWKVQINAAGAFRCNCPSYIFSGRGGAVRTCKHVRYCADQRSQDTGQSTPVVPAPTAKATPQQHPQWASAVTICNAMVDQSRIQVTMAQLTAMCEVLATKLAAFVPAKPAPATVATGGVRHITFEDSDD